MSWCSPSAVFGAPALAAPANASPVLTLPSACGAAAGAISTDVDSLTPALVATILGQAEPTWHWDYDGTDQGSNAHHLDYTGGTVVEETSSALGGGNVSSFTAGGGDTMRADLAVSGAGDVGAETVTIMLILDVTSGLVANRGIFANREGSGGTNGFAIEGAGGSGAGNGFYWQCDCAVGADSTTCDIGLGAQVILMTRSIAGDIFGAWSQGDSSVGVDATLGSTLTNGRPVQFGANANRVSEEFSVAGALQWVGTDGDFGTAADFAAARLAMAVALGLE